MIQAGYAMDLYCDNDEMHGFMGAKHVSHKSNVPIGGRVRHGGYQDYTGQTWGDCAKQARKDGWRISRDRQRAYCPRCGGPRKGPR